MKEKKQWHKPALIVLVRRKPEEAVLVTCKYLSEIVSGMTRCGDNVCVSRATS